MITASQMLKNSIERGEKLAKEVYDESDFKQCCIKRIKQESDNGEVIYKFSGFKEILYCNKDRFMNLLYKDIEEFEENGFMVIVIDFGNEYYFKPLVFIYWGGDVNEFANIITRKDIYSSKKVEYITHI